MIRSFLTILTATVSANLVLIFLFVQNAPASSNLDRSVKVELKTGDLVLRDGRGLVSGWFKSMSLNDKKYSHCGLVLKTKQGDFVAHFYQENKNRLFIEPLEKFIDSRLCSGFGIYRYDLSAEQKAGLVKNIVAELNAPGDFDNEFMLNNGKKYYCTEWVRNELIDITKNTSLIQTTVLDDYEYVSAENLYLNKNSKFLFSQNYTD
jgi:hypothetical protein